MNPLIHKQFEQIHAGLSEIRELLSVSRKEIRNERERRETLIQQHWRESKENVTLSDMVDDYSELQKQNEKYRLQRTELQEHLKKILSFTRAISSEIRG